jgi:sigma-B regulation protein RsbU (phosphoserine phosphatase)
MMVSARATLRTLATVLRDPARLFDDLAAGMFQDLTHTERFITAAAAILRAGDGVVDLVNAGHNDLMLYRAAERRVHCIPSQGTILGFMPRPTYQAQSVAMQPGDLLFLYTDGVTETLDGNGEMFGEARLAAVLERSAGSSAREVIAAVLAEVGRFRGVQVRGDDITCVAIRAVPPQGGRQ